MPPLDDMPGLLHLLQTAPAGSRGLDERIEAVLAERADGMATDGADRREEFYNETGMAVLAARWSQDLMSLLQLVPRDHNFSLGERDGVLWAWIQPNDEWVPVADEMRHDHPRGSGLIVACTLPLAMAAALVSLRVCPGRRPGAHRGD